MDITYYITYDLPVPYRNIKIYPATVRDYLLFNVFSQCLTLDKNSIPDPKVISMTELEYIYVMTQESPEKTPYLIWLNELLKMCLRDEESFKNPAESIQRYGFDKKGKPIFLIQDEVYTNKDFLQIRDIIAKQNMVELIDENISKEVRDSLEKAREFKRRQSNKKSISLEDFIVSLSSITGWTFDYIYSLSIRKFTKTIRRLDNYIHYKIYLTASVSGMVEFKDKSFIKHWLTNLDDDDKFGDVSMNLDELQDKISLETAKK